VRINQAIPPEDPSSHPGSRPSHQPRSPLWLAENHADTKRSSSSKPSKYWFL
jgi:hypothetical protein